MEDFVELSDREAQELFLTDRAAFKVASRKDRGNTPDSEWSKRVRRWGQTQPPSFGQIDIDLFFQTQNWKACSLIEAKRPGESINPAQIDNMNILAKPRTVWLPAYVVRDGGGDFIEVSPTTETAIDNIKSVLG